MATPDVESYLTTLVRASKTPGIQYLAVNAAGTLFEFAGGWSDLRRQTPITAATTMMAYSMSKTVTAAAVLQLVEGGKVGLDEPAERYVDAFPYGPRVTVRHLITHTSGIPNPIPLRWVHPVAIHASFDEDAALAAVLRAHPRVSFEPGSKYRYSNIGYWLLGRVVARASGETFQAFVKRHVLEPLRLSPAELGYEVAAPGHHACGYLEKYSLINLIKGLVIDRALIGGYSGRWLEIRGHYLNGPAFGGLVGRATAFGTFLRDQLSARSVLFTAATRDLFYERQTAGGQPIAMTLGWHVGERDGRTFFYKEGGGGGFHCMMRLYREEGIGTVVMTNATGFDVRHLLDKIDPRH